MAPVASQCLEEQVAENAFAVLREFVLLLRLLQWFSEDEVTCQSDVRNEVSRMTG